MSFDHRVIIWCETDPRVTCQSDNLAHQTVSFDHRVIIWHAVGPRSHDKPIHIPYRPLRSHVQTVTLHQPDSASNFTFSFFISFFPYIIVTVLFSCLQFSGPSFWSANLAQVEVLIFIRQVRVLSGWPVEVDITRAKCWQETWAIQVTTKWSVHNTSRQPLQTCASPWHLPIIILQFYAWEADILRVELQNDKLNLPYFLYTVLYLVKSCDLSANQQQHQCTQSRSKNRRYDYNERNEFLNMYYIYQYINIYIYQSWLGNNLHHHHL